MAGSSCSAARPSCQAHMTNAARASARLLSVWCLNRSTISSSSAGVRLEPMLRAIASASSRAANASSAVWPRRASVCRRVRSWRPPCAGGSARRRSAAGDRTSLTARRVTPWHVARAARARASVHSVRSMTSRTLARSMSTLSRTSSSWWQPLWHSSYMGWESRSCSSRHAPMVAGPLTVGAASRGGDGAMAGAQPRQV